MLRVLSSRIILCVFSALLTSCGNFDAEFLVKSVKTTVEVSDDGSAEVSENFAIAVKKSTNYGGVYVDIPQRFKDASGNVHRRDFELFSTRHDGREEHHFVEQNVPGYSIYIGREHCKRCPTNIPVGVSYIKIIYKLGRLVREEGDRQVLVLPAYMGRVHDWSAEKTVVLTVPPGGVLRSSKLDPAAYEMTQNAPGEIEVSIAAGEPDRVLPDIEIEYPKGTFRQATIGMQARWWLSDHFLTSISIGGPLIAGLFVALRLRSKWQLPENLADVDTKVVRTTSPALAAYLFWNWKEDAAKAAFLASVCHLAVKRKFRISGLNEDAEASELSAKKPRKGKVTGVRWYSLPAASRLVFEQIEKENPVDDRRRIMRAWNNLNGELHKKVVEEYGRLSSGMDRSKLVTVLSVLVLSVGVAYFAGLLLYSVAVCGILLMSLFVAMGILRPERINWPNNFKDAFGLYIGLPVLAVIALYYITTAELVSEQWPYVLAILLDIAAVVVALKMKRMPTPTQRQLRNNLLALNRYFLGKIDGPKMSVESYERCLPFAIAFGAEQRWTERFNQWLASENMDAYAPDWLKKS
ncbi:putative membrane protein (DUF2207) [Rhizobium sp. CF142]|nr:DUF2207 domain-containing protein [Rhizobium sp. CF142]EJJ30644.1 putative membrane protein (DUF2207) [Rhizobium sp. CF142]